MKLLREFLINCGCLCEIIQILFLLTLIGLLVRACTWAWV